MREIRQAVSREGGRSRRRRRGNSAAVRIDGGSRKDVSWILPNRASEDNQGGSKRVGLRSPTVGDEFVVRRLTLGKGGRGRDV